ncbi:hypothetical protein Tco_0705514 [Tanacetum coccineum]|uniref:Reverse transcriptase domain-containing protein n=1 Tax=Tanacetum coccineum TaxID=301880 RepID=A0ABQ4Y4T7_9ASTR
MENPTETLWKDSKHKIHGCGKRSVRNAEDSGFMTRVDYVLLQGEVARIRFIVRKKTPACGNSQKEEDSQTLKKILGMSTDELHAAEETDKNEMSKSIKGIKANVTPEFLFGTTISFPAFMERKLKRNDQLIIEAENRRALRSGQNNKAKMIPATTSLMEQITIGETIGRICHISLLVKIRKRVKKDSCRTIHGTQNVKIPGKRRNDNNTKQQSHPDGIGYDGRPAAHGGAPPKCLRGIAPCQTEKETGGCKPPKRNKAIQEEVEKLVDAGIMKEVHYHSWLSNSVMVKKHDGSWRMCVDFKDLNKACPQDGYPLLEIDWKVESLCGYPY